MCYTLVFGHKMVTYFGVGKSRQRKDPKEVN